MIPPAIGPINDLRVLRPDDRVSGWAVLCRCMTGQSGKKTAHFFTALTSGPTGFKKFEWPTAKPFAGTIIFFIFFPCLLVISLLCLAKPNLLAKNEGCGVA